MSSTTDRTETADELARQSTGITGTFSFPGGDNFKEDPVTYPVTGEMQARLDRDFVYHPPKGNQADRYEEIRRQAKVFAYTLCRLIPPSREQSVALTHLEQVVFAANAAIARNE